MKFYPFDGPDSLRFVYMVGMRITGLLWLCIDWEKLKKCMSTPFPTDTAFHSILLKIKPRPEHYLRLVCPFKMELMSIYVQPLTERAGT